MSTIYQKPFLKWVGGKTQLLNTIVKQFPKKINNYHEIFLGGGSVLFAMLTLQQLKKIEITGKIYAYDINEVLINIYKNIQTNKTKLFNLIIKHKNEYNSIKGTVVNRKPKNIQEAHTSQESYYYWIRTQFNKLPNNSIVKCALFIFLNKLCFRGLYREGPNGFNVPFGHYKKTPSIITLDELNKIHKLIKNVEFRCLDFAKSIKNAVSGDYLYLDPPYVPINKKSFVNYNVGGFNKKTHIDLFNIIKSLNPNIKFTLSNSNNDLVINSFQDYNIQYVDAKRSIHCKNPGTSATETIISN